MKQILSHQIIKANNPITKRTPIVLLHGLFGFKSNLRGIARKLSSETYLNNDRDFIMMDLRNHGNSFHSNDMALETMAKDVTNTLEYLSIDKAIWLGHSIGGKISMLAALHYPAFVAGLIVADIAPVSHDMDRYLDLAKVFKSMPMNNIVNKYECINWLEPRLPQFTTFELEFLLTNLVKDHKSGEWKWRINFDAIEGNLKSISGFNHNGLQYSEDTLFIGGSKADYLCPKYHLCPIKRIFPNSEIRMLTASHYLHVEKPKEFTDYIYEYIREIE